jgi:hypothetical protein
MAHSITAGKHSQQAKVVLLFHKVIPRLDFKQKAPTFGISSKGIAAANKFDSTVFVARLPTFI